MKYKCLKKPEINKKEVYNLLDEISDKMINWDITSTNEDIYLQDGKGNSVKIARTVLADRDCNIHYEDITIYLEEAPKWFINNIIATILYNL